MSVLGSRTSGRCKDNDFFLFVFFGGVFIKVTTGMSLCHPKTVFFKYTHTTHSADQAATACLPALQLTLHALLQLALTRSC